MSLETSGKRVTANMTNPEWTRSQAWGHTLTGKNYGSQEGLPASRK